MVLHPSMPQQLKEHIVSKWRRHCEGDAAKEARCPQLRMVWTVLYSNIYSTGVHSTAQVWTSCEGETGADREHLGAVTYTPWQGFPGGRNANTQSIKILCKMSVNLG